MQEWAFDPENIFFTKSLRVFNIAFLSISIYHESLMVSTNTLSLIRPAIFVVF